MHVESNKTKTFRPLLLCMINTPHGLSEYTNIWVHPIKTFLWQHILRIPFFYIRPKNCLHFYTPCQVLVINLDKTSSMAKFSWSFVRWAMLQTVNWVILPNGMMQNTLQLIMPQVCHITCSAILPALTPACCYFNQAGDNTFTTWIAVDTTRNCRSQSWTLHKSADCRWISITILYVSFTNSATVRRLEQVQLCNRLIDQSADNITGLKCAKECLILKCKYIQNPCFNHYQLDSREGKHGVSSWKSCSVQHWIFDLF